MEYSNRQSVNSIRVMSMRIHLYLFLPFVCFCLGIRSSEQDNKSYRLPHCNTCELLHIFKQKHLAHLDEYVFYWMKIYTEFNLSA